MVIKSESKKDYLFALNKADTGDLSYFINFIGKEIIWSLNLCVSAAKGLDIEEEDDLDKELELIKKQLQDIPDEYDKKLTHSELREVAHKSIVPLFMQIHSKLEALRSLFVEVIDRIEYNEYDEHGSLINGTYDFDGLYLQQEVREVPAFKNILIHELTIVVECNALKKVTKPTNMCVNYTMVPEEYHYLLIDRISKETIIRLPYGRFYTQDDINRITATALRKLLAEIRTATGLKY